MRQTLRHGLMRCALEPTRTRGCQFPPRSNMVRPSVKILVHGIFFAPVLTGVGKYTGEMASWLASRGHEVRVVTAPPYYPDWRVSPGYRAGRYATERWQGARVWRCPVWVPARPGGLARLLHLASFATSSFPVMVRQLLWRPDVVLVVEPPLFCAPTGWLVARLCGARAWLHVQDYEVDAAFELGLLRGATVRRMATVWERSLMRRFDRVSTISQRMPSVRRQKECDRSGWCRFPTGWIWPLSLRRRGRIFCGRSWASLQTRWWLCIRDHGPEAGA